LVIDKYTGHIDPYSGNVRTLHIDL
jgi:hypothetical protein